MSVVSSLGSSVILDGPALDEAIWSPVVGEQNEITKSSRSIPMRFVPVPWHCLIKRVREILEFTVFLILSEPVELNFYSSRNDLFFVC